MGVLMYDRVLPHRGQLHGFLNFDKVCVVILIVVRTGASLTCPFDAHRMPFSCRLYCHLFGIARRRLKNFLDISERHHDK